MTEAHCTTAGMVTLLHTTLTDTSHNNSDVCKGILCSTVIKCAHTYVYVCIRKSMWMYVYVYGQRCRRKKRSNSPALTGYRLRSNSSALTGYSCCAASLSVGELVPAASLNLRAASFARKLFEAKNCERVASTTESRQKLVVSNILARMRKLSLLRALNMSYVALCGSLSLPLALFVTLSRSIAKLGASLWKFRVCLVWSGLVHAMQIVKCSCIGRICCSQFGFNACPGRAAVGDRIATVCVWPFWIKSIK